MRSPRLFILFVIAAMLLSSCVTVAPLPEPTLPAPLTPTPAESGTATVEPLVTESPVAETPESTVEATAEASAEPTAGLLPEETAELAPEETEPAPLVPTAPPPMTPIPVPPAASAAPAQAEPVPQRIQFAAGATSAVVQSYLPGYAIDRWVVRAGAGQTMYVQTAFGSGKAILTIFGADGTDLLDEEARAANWSGVVPSSQDYYIDVLSTSSGITAYSLQVTIPAAATPGPAVRRIQFAAGATSATVTGQLSGRSTDRWLVKAGAGQTMTAKLTFSSGQAILIIFGADGTVLVTDHSGVSEWTGQLPSTQDYNVDVRGVVDGTTSYTLQVTIPPLPNPGPTTRRIQFAPGATSATVTGQLSGRATDRWLVKAGAGQTMTAKLTFSSGQAILIIFGADGTVLVTDHSGVSEWTGQLPSTQDYNIDVRGVVDGPTAYSLQVTIPPLPNPNPTVRRIQFAPGATSATVTGQINGRFTDRWLVKAGAGQTMTAKLTFSSGQAILIIFGADGTVLISDHAGVSEWTGQLPRTQDYNVDVRGVVDGTTSYSLQVTIPPVASTGPTVRRIRFAPGGTSATVTGHVAAGGIDRWLVGAGAGQTLQVNLVPSSGQAILVIFGADGTVLMSDHAGATSFSGVLPRTQDYNVDVRAPASGAADYTLTVTIPPL